MTLLSGLNNIPDEMNRICIAEDGEIRGKMAIFVIPISEPILRSRNRFGPHRNDRIAYYEEDNESLARHGRLPLLRLRSEQSAGTADGILRKRR